MKTRLRVGNLDDSMDASKLESLFTPFGAVANAFVAIYGLSGRSRGFGFVEMANAKEAEESITNLNGREHEGRELSVRLASADEGVVKKRRAARA